jgi:hypothetical protein
MSLESIGSACARGMGSPYTIFFFIVRLFVPYGMLSLVALGCPRLCLVGGGCSLRVLLCGRWCPLALCGAFGKNE